MMKRMLCLVLCLGMMLTSVCAVAENKDMSLAEKLQRQIEFGNGVKGAVVINAQGEGELAQALAPLNGTEIQIRSIKQQDGDDFQLYLYTLDGEEQVGLTRFWSAGDNLYMSSELLPELVLTYATGGDLLESLFATGENAGWYSAAMNLMTVPETVWAEDWAPLMEPYYAQIEDWLTAYAAEPQVNYGEKGETLMTVRYELPMDAIVQEIKALLRQVFGDEALLRMLSSQLTDVQQYVYLTPGFLYYYEAALDAINLEGEIVLERDLSAQGETMSTSLQFPLSAVTGWQMLTFDQTGDDISLVLNGDSMQLALEMSTVISESKEEYTGVVHVNPAAEDEKALAAAFHVTRVYTNSVDEDTREHDINTWTIDVSMDETVLGDEDYMAFEPIGATLMTHIHSKNALGNATTLEVSATYAQGDNNIAVAGSIKTARPWVMDQLAVDGAEDVSAMSENYLAEIFGTLWSKLCSEITAMKGIELPAPEAATVTDITP